VNSIVAPVIFALALSLLSVSGGSQPAYAADCPAQCAQKFGELKKQEAEEGRTAELLGKNRSYLAGLSPKEASKFIKVESNIMVILVRLEEIRKQITTLRSELEKEGCNKCQ
jgi:hypothetical protein